jgi:hypothetical protein
MWVFMWKPAGSYRETIKRIKLRFSSYRSDRCKSHLAKIVFCQTVPASDGIVIRSTISD